MAKQDDQNVNSKSSVVYGAVLSLAFSIVSGLLVGWALDRWLGTSPWLIVAGIVLGSVAGFMQFIRLMSRIT
ncbi:MAG: putative F0F1-ATPase subunit Ca2+/Mg2+ transporter [Pyrinomonadaceae bacterium]|nr:putative F0F1-ATPase subunit Ca2+/Mg2+ transporter [Pyrinomonadaceae bacterium]MDQ1612971.1 putative F0F1-ATPase subunit Ca2+/Mg2+ transporter [Pyrinomonadaceae bacterium]